jgi:hypothetical protein
MRLLAKKWRCYPNLVLANVLAEHRWTGHRDGPYLPDMALATDWVVLSARRPQPLLRNNTPSDSLLCIYARELWAI